jgi:hypothetical protein
LIAPAGPSEGRLLPELALTKAMSEALIEPLMLTS